MTKNFSNCEPFFLFFCLQGAGTPGAVVVRDVCTCTKKEAERSQAHVAVELCKINVGVNGALPLILVVVPEHKKAPLAAAFFSQESIDMII